MISLIARKEMTEMLRDGRFRSTAAIVGILLIGAFATGFTQYRKATAERSAARQAAREHWLGQPPKNAHSAAHYGVYAFKPAATLSFVDRGVEPYVGVFAWLEAHKQNDFKYRPAQDATALERMGTWTAASVLQLLIPLLIIVLCFPAFAGERELGTLRQLFSAGVPPRTLALGKALGVAGALAVLLVPAAILGGATLSLSPTLSAGGGDGYIRAAALSLAYLVYFAGFVAIALAVSARSRTSRGALIALLAFWAVNAFVAPRAASDVARRAYPTPSALNFNRALERELIMDGDQQTALEDSVRRAYGVTSLDSLPVNYAAISLQAGEVHGYEVFDRHYGALDATFAAQERIQSSLGLFAPLLAVRSVSMALAGTDREHHRHFAGAAEQYRRQLVELMNNSLLPKKDEDAFAGQADSTLWQQLPDFTYTGPSLQWVVGKQGLSMAILLLWVVASILLAVVALRRVTAPVAESA
jgi:ABC-2 type transport system permease protein